MFQVNESVMKRILEQLCENYPDCFTGVEDIMPEETDREIRDKIRPHVAYCYDKGCIQAEVDWPHRIMLIENIRITANGIDYLRSLS